MQRRIALITGAIAPYTNRLYDAFAAKTGDDLHVFTCSAREPQRLWDIPSPQHYRLKRLRGLAHHASYTSHVYVNPGVISNLTGIKPDLIILDGFSPTMVAASLYGFARRIPVAVMTDGSVATDPGKNSRVHRWMRQMVVPRAAAGICASEDSARLLAAYGLSRARCKVVPIVPAWDGPTPWPGFAERPYHVMFCGGLEDRWKGARYFAQTMLQLNRKFSGLRVRVVGDGPLRREIEEMLGREAVNARIDGHLQGDELANAFSSCKLLAFPSRGDAWGLVVNEAAQCGTPIISSPFAPSAHELVAPFGAGLVLPLDISLWTTAITSLLEDECRWRQMQVGCTRSLPSFSRDKAVDALKGAIESAIDPAARNAASRLHGARPHGEKESAL